MLIKENVAALYTVILPKISTRWPKPKCFRSWCPWTLWILTSDLRPSSITLPTIKLIGKVKADQIAVGQSFTKKLILILSSTPLKRTMLEVSISTNSSRDTIKQLINFLKKTLKFKILGLISMEIPSMTKNKTWRIWNLRRQNSHLKCGKMSELPSWRLC